MTEGVWLWLLVMPMTALAAMSWRIMGARLDLSNLVPVCVWLLLAQLALTAVWDLAR